MYYTICMSTIKKHVVVYTYQNKNGCIMKLARTFDVTATAAQISDYDSVMVTTYGRWLGREYFTNQEIAIIENGINDGGFDVSRFEK